MDNNTYPYYCKCYSCKYEVILCKECSKLVAVVETTIEKHLNQLKPVVNAKRWKNNKNNQKQ